MIFSNDYATTGSLFDGLPTVDRFYTPPKTARTREDIVEENEAFLKRVEAERNRLFRKKNTDYGPYEWTLFDEEYVYIFQNVK